MATLSFWLNFIGVNVTFWPLFVIGKEGMPRRYWNYEMFSDVTVWGMHFQDFQRIATYGSWIIAAGMLLQFMNFIKAAINGPVAPTNPWGSKSLEWTHTASPPGPGNFGDTDVVVDENWSPYEYNKG